MSVKGFKDIVSTEWDILSSDREGKHSTISLQMGDASASLAGDIVALWQQIGFASLPSKVSPDGKNLQCAQALVLNIAGDSIAVATRDTRYNDVIGSLQPGETCVYATGADGTGQGRILLKDLGRMMIYTKKNAETATKAMSLLMDPQTDTIALTNSLGYGLIIKEDGVYVKGPGGALKIDSSGCALIATTGKAQIDGPGIVLGSVAVPGLNSALTGATGIAGVASTKVLIATA